MNTENRSSRQRNFRVAFVQSASLRPYKHAGGDPGSGAASSGCASRPAPGTLSSLHCGHTCPASSAALANVLLNFSDVWVPGALSTSPVRRISSSPSPDSPSDRKLVAAPMRFVHNGTNRDRNLCQPNRTCTCHEPYMLRTDRSSFS